MRQILPPALILATLTAVSSMAMADQYAGPPAPQALVIVSCRAVDFTGLPGRHGVDPETGEYDPAKAAHGWRDLELYINRSQEYECKRELLPLLDAVTMYWPPKLAKPINPNFADTSKCGRVGVSVTAGWQFQHRGWAVVAVGCPSAIGIDHDGDGEPDRDALGRFIVHAWKLPGCPTFLPGSSTSPMKCRFDASAI